MKNWLWNTAHHLPFQAELLEWACRGGSCRSCLWLTVETIWQTFWLTCWFIVDSVGGLFYLARSYMASFAHGEFVGNMVADPEYKTYGKKDSPMLSGRMAVNLSKKNSEGEWENVPLWVAFAYFGANAENLAEKIAKGDTVLVAGRIEPETYKKEGVEVRGFKVVATTVQLLTSKTAKQAEDDEEEEEEKPRMKSRF